MRMWVFFLLGSLSLNSAFAASPFEDGVYEGELKKYGTDGTVELGTLRLTIAGDMAHGLKTFDNKEKVYEVFADFENDQYFKIFKDQRSFDEKRNAIGDGLCNEISCQYAVRQSVREMLEEVMSLPSDTAAFYHNEIFIKTEDGIQGFGNIEIQMLNHQVVRVFWVSTLVRVE